MINLNETAPYIDSTYTSEFVDKYSRISEAITAVNSASGPAVPYIDTSSGSDIMPSLSTVVETPRIRWEEALKGLEKLLWGESDINPISREVSEIFNPPTVDSNNQRKEFGLSELIEQLRAVSTNVAERVSELQEFAVEDDEQDDISTDSLQWFINFMIEHNELREPELVLSTTGHIHAEWHESWDKHVEVVFLPNGEVRYVVFTPDPSNPALTFKSATKCSPESMLKSLGILGFMDWAGKLNFVRSAA